MNIKRTFEEFINEQREDVGKYNTVKKVIAKLGRRPSEQDLATFINNNYYDVTEVERGEDDPSANDKIADLVAFYKFDIDDWEIAWADAQNEAVVNEKIHWADNKKYEKYEKIPVTHKYFDFWKKKVKSFYKEKSVKQMADEFRIHPRSINVIIYDYLAMEPGFKLKSVKDAEIKKDLATQESVVNEGKTSAVYTDPKTGKGYDLQYVSSKKRWELDVMKKGASIYSNAITTIKRDTLAEIQEWLDGYKIDSSWTKGLSESLVTEAKNTIGLAFKDEDDYTGFVEFIKDEKGSIKKDFGWDSKTKSWEVIMDVKVLDRIYGEGTPSNKESGWYGGLPGDFESVIIESAMIEALSASDRKAIAYTMAEQDPSKIKDLQDAIGQEFSDNYSSTNRSILVDVKKKGGKWVAITSETESEYNNKKPKKGKREATIGITWNAMFF